MKLAYSTNAYTNNTLTEALTSIAALGFSGAEILCDHPHWFPGRVDAGELDAIRRLLAEKGLAVSNLNVNTANAYFDPLPPENVFEPALSSSNKAYREWRTQYSIDALHLADGVGANCISVTSGTPGSGGEPAEGLTLFVDSLKRICEVAERLDVRVGIEYEPGLLVERASEVKDMIQHVGSSQLGVNLDIGHSFLNREPPEEPLRELAGRIWNAHIEDIAGLKHFHRVPGQGDMPLQRYLELFDESGYDNYLTVELYTYPHKPEWAGAESLKHLKGLMEKAGIDA